MTSQTHLPFLSYSNLVAPVRFEIQKPQFAQESNTLKELMVVRACLHGSEGPQVGEVTRLGGVKK